MGVVTKKIQVGIVDDHNLLRKALAKLIGAFRVDLIDKTPVTPVGVVTTQPDHSPMFTISPR